MGSKQRSIEVIRMFDIAVDVERKLTDMYGDEKFDIIDVLSQLPCEKEFNVFTEMGFVVHFSHGDYFFSANVVYETPDTALVVDITEIELDTFLEFINNQQYIRYGV